MPSPYPHGTYSAYAKDRCRCDVCRLTHNQRIREGRARRLAEGRVRHGTAGWDDGCRCDTCRRAHKAAGLRRGT